MPRPTGAAPGSSRFRRTARREGASHGVPSPFSPEPQPLRSARAPVPHPPRRGGAGGAGRAAGSDAGGARFSSRARRATGGRGSRGGAREPAAPRARDGRRDRQGVRARRGSGRATRAGSDARGRARRRRRTGRARRGRRPSAGLLADRHRALGRRSGLPAGRGRAAGSRPVTAVSVHELVKRYGDQEAVAGVSFDIGAGEVFGLLGPNGAGKTTTVEILEGYRKRDGGAVEVLGEDPQRAGSAWRELIGVVLQQSQMWANLTARETLAMFAGYYAKPRDVDEVVELVGLTEKRDERVKTLSGGQKRRLDLGLALVGDPQLVFLDEPTTGFDPQARRAAWEMVRSLRALGKTILLTTHYLDEAQNLADRVAVLVAGEIVRLGRPDDLMRDARSAEVHWRENG